MNIETADTLLEDFDQHRGKVVVEIGSKDTGVVKMVFIRNNKLMYRFTDNRDVKVSDYVLQNLMWHPIEKHPESDMLVLAIIQTMHDCFCETCLYAFGKFVLPGRGESHHVTHWAHIPLPESVHITSFSSLTGKWSQE